MIDATTILISAIEIVVVICALMGGVVVMTWIERRLSAVIQFRWGPNRVGPFGLFQPFADGIKFLLKEDIFPADSYRPIFLLAPGLALVTALFGFSVIPFGSSIELFGRQIDLVILDMNGGLLFGFAATAIGVYALVCAGWASKSKYSLMGGLRSSSQMISYELALGLSVIGVLMVSSSLRPTVIVEQQAGWFWNWNAIGGGQILGFLIFVIAGFAETNRLPFDLPEAESELVAGYHTEYSSMKFSMFFMAEYVAMIVMASMVVTLFLGGYNPGFPVPFDGWPLVILQVACFVAKVGFFMILFVWVRWTLPRFRYDQLMTVGWKRLFPLALFNIFLSGLLVALDVI